MPRQLSRRVLLLAQLADRGELRGEHRNDVPAGGGDPVVIVVKGGVLEVQPNSSDRSIWLCKRKPEG